MGAGCQILGSFSTDSPRKLEESRWEMEQLDFKSGRDQPATPQNQTEGLVYSNIFIYLYF